MHIPALRPSGLRRPTFAVLLLLAALAVFAPVAARAQVVKAWAPPADSITRLAGSAKLRFQRQRGDSVSGDNFDGYEVVGDIGRKLFASLGKRGLVQAQAVQTTLDSLGLDVEVRTDPQQPTMVFMLVRNPFLRSSDAIGFIYWMQGPLLRMQGASYPPSQDVQVRFWYTGRQDVPYEALTLYRSRRDNGLLNLRLYRMNDGGTYWNLVQYEGNAPDLGTASTASFVDINRDGMPELVVYRIATPDTVLQVATEAPQLVEEYTYTERPEGFVLHDVRLLPGPTETIHMFVSLLVNHEPEFARRLLVDPASLDSMMAIGWGQHVRRGDWQIEYGEAQPWPEWLELKIREDRGLGHYVFHFWIKDGRWVIRNWLREQPPSPNNVLPKPKISTVTVPGTPPPAPAAKPKKDKGP